MLSRMNLTDEAVEVVVASNGQGLIAIDYFAQLNYKSVEGICWVLRRPGGFSGGVPNLGVVVPAMSEANLQGMIYYINHFKSIGRTFSLADVDLSKVRDMYHQRDMKEVHKDPKVVPTVYPRDWPKTLEKVE